MRVRGPRSTTGCEGIEKSRTPLVHAYDRLVRFAPRLVPLALLSLFAACGGASYAKGRAPGPRSSVAASLRGGASAPRVTRPPPASPIEAPAASNGEEGDAPEDSASSQSPDPLERPAGLRRFFEALARLEDGRAHDDVRVELFGDSHTAADYETGPMRRALQGRFGDGGRGFLEVGRPWKWYVQEGVHLDGMSGWVAERGHPARGGFVGDGMYGLVGVSIESSRAGARAWTDLSAHASRIEIAYLERPGGGSVDVLVDGVRQGRIGTRGKLLSDAYRGFDLSDAPHQVELVAVGDGPVRVFGMTLDSPQVGLTLDALGINGARVAGLLHWNESHMTEQLRHRAPDLVVLAYGANEAGDDTPLDVYARQLVDVLGRVARAVPGASCMLLGPPDRAQRIDPATGLPSRAGAWTTMPRLLDVIGVQRKVAEAAGCAFYDQLTAMGGPGTIAGWATEDPPRAMLDRVHLSRDGYAQLGNRIASDLIHAYAAWRADAGLPPPPQRPQPSQWEMPVAGR